MIHLFDDPPRDEVLAQLEAWQRELDGMPNYADRVQAASTQWDRRCRPDNLTFCEIRGALKAMAGGAERCCYCEDSLAHQIEHVRPKSHYPDYTFVWDNMLWACGYCNNRKLDHFAVISNGQLVEVPRRRAGQPPVPPPAGEMAFLDPRGGDPMTFMRLDLVDTFKYSPIASPGTRDFVRADYTIRTLDLNLDPFPDQRLTAYADFRARLCEYVAWKDRGEPFRKLEGLRARLRRSAHQTVWREILRAYLDGPCPEQIMSDFGMLFDQAPEAFDW